MKLHVLYVINSLAASGGAEQSLAAMAPHLVQRGVTLDVAYLEDDNGLEPCLARAGAQLFPIRARRAVAVVRLVGLARARLPDLVHTTLYEADQAGRMAGLITGIPTVTSLVNSSYGPEHLGDPRLRAWKVRAAQVVEIATARAAGRFHANSRHVAEVMARRLLVPRHRIDVIPRGRDPEVLGRRTEERRRRVRSSLGLPRSTPVVLAAARHEHQKGLDVLVEAAGAMVSQEPGIQVLIAGREGNQTRLLHSIVARRGLADSVRFLGSRSDVADLLVAADVLVLSSRWEGLPGVLIEAMALETPIVATRIPAVGEVVGFGADAVAAVVPPERPDALAEAILSTLRDQAASERARSGRKRFLESFTIERTVDRMVDFYERSVADAGHLTHLI